MRATSVLRTLLALHRTRVVDLEFTEEALIADVVPNWQIPRCSGCGKKRRSVYDSRVRAWRHLDLGGINLSVANERPREGSVIRAQAA